MVSAMKKYMSDPSSTLVDLGTADALMLSAVKQAFPSLRCIGIEVSRDLLMTSSDRELFLLQGDAARLPLPDRSADIVTAAAVIEHMADPAVVLQEVKRVIREKGILIVTSPDPFWEKAATLIGHLPQEQHTAVPDMLELTRLFSSAGFQVVERKKFMLSPVGTPLELQLESLVRRLGMNFLFANQLIVGRST